MWNVCPKCNHLNNDDTTRCEQCGYRLSQPISVDQPKRARVPVAPHVGREPRPRHRYFENWFGPHVAFEDRRRNGAIVAIGLIMFTLAVVYAAIGLYCNTFVWLVFAAVLGWAIHRARGEKWSDAKTAIVALFLVLPMLVAAVVPWQPLADRQEEDTSAPIFVDYLGYRVEGYAHVVVDGWIANEGTRGGQAMIHISVFAGMPPDNSGDLTHAWVNADVYTGWIPAHGSANVNWYCNLEYFTNGYVMWTIADVTSPY